MIIFWETNQLTRISIIAMCGNSFENKDAYGNLKKKKCAFLKDEVSNWLRIWTTASLFDVKGSKAIKKNFVLANWSVSQIRSHT